MDLRLGITPLLLFPLAAALVASCASTADATAPEPPASPSSASAIAEQRARLAAFQPVDIAVAPVRNLSTDPRVAGEVLRAHLVDALVAKLYSPLDLRYFDARAGEAGFSPRELGAEAVLQVTIAGYDTALLRLNGAVKVRGDALLLDGSDPASEPLWSTTFDRRLELGPISSLPAADGPLYAEAAQQIAELIMAGFPERSSAAPDAP
jgi:hypothetical protein